MTPAQRFTPTPPAERDLVGLWLPPALEPLTGSPTPSAPGPMLDPVEAVELEKVVPAAGNMALCGQQFWLGPARAGQLVSFWVDCNWAHLSIGGTRIKTVRSHLTVIDLAHLRADGARPAGPPPLPGTVDADGVVEVERVVSRGGTVQLGGRVVLAAEILGGRQVGSGSKGHVAVLRP